MRKALNAKAIEALKPSAKRYEVHDLLCPGFSVRVYPTGRKVFTVKYRYGLKQRRLPLGIHPRLALADARARAMEALRQVDEGIDPSVNRRQLNMRVEAICADFIRQYARPRNRSWQEAERIIKREFVAAHGQQDIRKITRSDILGLIDAAIERGSAYQANRIHSLTLRTEAELEAAVPAFFRKVLSGRREQLASRSDIKRSTRTDWWGLSQRRSFGTSKAPRIVSKYFGKEGSFALDERAEFVVVQGFAWFPRWTEPSSLIEVGDHNEEIESEGVDVVSTCDYLAAYAALFNAELPAHAHLHDIAFLAVGRDHLVKVGLVRAFDRAAVDVAGLPQVTELAEALAESPGVARRVAEGEPDDFRLFVGQRAFDDFPHRIGDVGAFIGDDDDPLALVVQAGEGFGVVFRPSDRIAAPAILMARQDGENAGLGRLPPTPRDRQIAPLEHFWPGLGADLRFGVRGQDDAGVFAGIEAPRGQHADKGRLADTMAGRNRDPQRDKARLGIAQVVADVFHDIALPFARLRGVCERAGAPRVGIDRMAQGIVREARDIFREVQLGIAGLTGH